jgi:hypothetical protein
LDSPKVREHNDDLGIDMRIILKWILSRYGRMAWTGLNWLGYRPVAGSCEEGNESSASITEGKFLEKLSDYLLLKKNTALWS